MTFTAKQIETAHGSLPAWGLVEQKHNPPHGFTQYRRSMACPDLTSIVVFGKIGTRPKISYTIAGDNRIFLSLDDALRVLNARLAA